MFKADSKMMKHKILVPNEKKFILRLLAYL